MEKVVQGNSVGIELVNGWHESPVPSIGVFDSGLGGLTVAREVLRQLPGVPMVYLADMAHVPYGPRTACEIRTFARGIIHALQSAGAVAVIAACNMSSALALPVVREEFDLPLVGMIIPGVYAALQALEDGPLGVLATEGTCNSGAYPAQARVLRPELDVVQVACPDFVPLVEAGMTDGPEAQDAARRYLKPLLTAGCRTIILGCTHYPWLLPVLRDVAGSGIQFIDPAQAAVENLRRKILLPATEANFPRHRFAATAHPDRLEAGIRRWLSLEEPAEYWPVWESAAMLTPEIALLQR